MRLIIDNDENRIYDMVLPRNVYAFDAMYIPTVPPDSCDVPVMKRDTRAETLTISSIDTIVFSVTLFIQVLLMRKHAGKIKDKMNNDDAIPKSDRNIWPVQAPTGPAIWVTDEP
jgi:hypothetical protein